jgi:hypothetical protein
MADFNIFHKQKTPTREDMKNYWKADEDEEEDLKESEDSFGETRIKKSRFPPVKIPDSQQIKDESKHKRRYKSPKMSRQNSLQTDEEIIYQPFQVIFLKIKTIIYLYLDLSRLQFILPDKTNRIRASRSSGINQDQIQLQDRILQ